MRNLTRAGIVSAIYEKCDVSRTDATRILEQVIDTIVTSLGREEAVKIISFCNFQVRHKRARMGRNPKTKENYAISKRKVVTAKFSHILKEEMFVNGK